MSDLMERLESLHAGPPGAVDEAVVARDVRRGHAAFVTRRRRRAAVAGGATLGIVAVGSLSFAAVNDGSAPTRHAPQAQSPAGPHTTVRDTERSTSAATTPTTTRPSAPTVDLVAYKGRQLPGYTIKEVPKGYVLQGVSGSVLDVAKKGDTSPLNTFVGKIVVMLNDHPSTEGVPVTVDGHPGRLDDQDGVLILTWDAHGRHVEVQSWSNVHITRAQLIHFAEGVTVLPGAQVGHG